MSLRIEIQLFSFLLTELSSPIRSREQVSSGGEPSTSGRRSTINVRQYGTIWANRRPNMPEFRAAPSNSGLRDDILYRNIDHLQGLYFEENGRFLPVEDNNPVVTIEGFIVGIVIDGYIRPIYNIHQQTILCRLIDRVQFHVSLKEIEDRFNVNTRLPDEYLNSNRQPTTSNRNRKSNNREM